MPTQEYHLYRVKIIRSSYPTLYHSNLSPAEIFRSAIKECPRLDGGGSVIWHIGNIEFLNESDGTFAIGKTTKKTTEKFNENTKSFFLSRDETSPYTFIVFDSSLGVIGICRKPQLAANTKTIARKLKKLISNSDFLKEGNVTVEVNHISDPTDFIDKIRDAYAITYFSSTFTGPNPTDADEIFQKPLAFFCQVIGGEHGSVSVSGDSLENEAVESVARSSAATGNEVRAKIRQLKTSKPLPVSFKGDPARLVVNSDISSTELADKMKIEYKRLRG